MECEAEGGCFFLPSELFLTECLRAALNPVAPATPAHPAFIHKIRFDGIVITADIREERATKFSHPTLVAP